MVLLSDLPLVNRSLNSWLKSQQGRRNGARPNFDKMHEVSRHTIHLSEVLSVALDTFEGIQEQFQEIHERLPATLSRTATGKMQNYMKFQFRAISGLRSRSESLRGRLQSEISLVIIAYALFSYNGLY